jgi:AcrR family transcriptional regulator
MQTLKKEIEERILNAARMEFAEHGFAKAKMRSIGERAGVSTGNLYTYFPNKDDLFCALVAPTVDQINAYTNYDRMRSTENGDECYTYEWHLDFYQEIADVHYRNHEDMKLILFKSQGSSLEDFRERRVSVALAPLFCGQHVHRDDDARPEPRGDDAVCNRSGDLHVLRVEGDRGITDQKFWKKNE